MKTISLIKPFGSYGPSLDLELLKHLDDSQLKKLIGSLNRAQFPALNRQRSELMSLLKEFAPLYEEKFDEYIDGFFGPLITCLNFSDVSDDFTSMTELMISESEHEKGLKEKATDFINSLTFIDTYFEQKRLEQYKRRGNIYFLNVSHACDLRGRFDRDYDYNSYESTSIEGYEPKILDLIPIVTLNFTFSGRAEPKVLSFQSDEDDLDKIISTLLAAQKEMKILKHHTKGAGHE